MSRDEIKARQWQIGIWELLVFTLAISLSLPALGVAVTQPLTGVSKFLAYFVGLSILAGSIGAMAWRLCLGRGADVIDGFLLGSSLAMIGLYLFLGVRTLF